MQKPHPRTLIVLAGPTASGKTDLGIWLAQALETEILSADSRQCYKELDIGVARPSALELQQVPHHFIASHSIHDSVNAGVYETYGLNILERLFKEHAVVLAVGGTGLYIKALTEGMDPMPPVEATVRQAVIQSYQQNGLSWLQSAVALEDPLFFAQAEQSNPQRLMRALEFIRTTGTSIVAFRKNKKQIRDFRVIYIGLTLPREELYQRINTRVEMMLEMGLEKEVHALYPYRQLNALQTVGYREWYPYFEGQADLLSVKQSIQQSTRHYAKRQITWFNRQEEFNWFSPADRENILSCIKSQLNGSDSV